MPARTSLRALGIAALGAAAVLTIQAPQPAAAASTDVTAPSVVAAEATFSAAQRVIAIARSELGRPWRYAATGPRAFDCSGLVLYAFRQAGVADRLGGGHSALGMWRWFAARGLASRSNPQVGDLVIYGRGSHVGIYIGNGRVISTLVSGVRIHGVHALRGRFTTFLHTGLSGVAVAAAATLASAPVAQASHAARTVSASKPRAASWRVTTDAVRLRAGASTRAAVLAVLGRGARVGVVGSARSGGRTWYHVRVGSRLGWIAAAYTRGA